MEKKREFMCPVCMKEAKEPGHLMGPKCEEEHQKQMLQALQNHQTPEPELDYAQKQAVKNLIFSREQLKELKEKTSLPWAQAYEQIRRECHGAGRLSKENFLQAVKIRFAEILEKSGMSKTAELIEVLGKRIYDLKGQIQWYEKIRIREKESAEQKKVGVV